MKIFEARNGNDENNALVNNQGTKQRPACDVVKLGNLLKTALTHFPLNVFISNDFFSDFC